MRRDSAARSMAGGAPPTMPATVRAYSEEENSRSASRRLRGAAPVAGGAVRRGRRAAGSRRLRRGRPWYDARSVFEQAENAENRRGIDGFAQRVVVEADVAAGDGNFQRAAGFGDAVDGFAELPHDFGLFGIAEIEAVGGGPGARADGGDVARGFGDGVHGAGARIERAPAAVAVGGKRERAARALEAHHGGIGRAGHGERVGAHHVIVLLEDPALRGDGRRGEQAAEIVGEIAAWRRERDARFGAGGTRTGRADAGARRRALDRPARRAGISAAMRP